MSRPFVSAVTVCGGGQAAQSAACVEAGSGRLFGIFMLLLLLLFPRHPPRRCASLSPALSRPPPLWLGLLCVVVVGGRGSRGVGSLIACPVLSKNSLAFRFLLPYSPGISGCLDFKVAAASLSLFYSFFWLRIQTKERGGPALFCLFF